jgi:acetyl-CoA acyltransferase 1
MNTKSCSEKSDNDVVIVAAVRTPLIRASNPKKPGQMADVSPADLLQTVLEATLHKVHPDTVFSTSINGHSAYGITGCDVQDLCVGNVLMVPSDFVTLRMAAIAAGLPAESCSVSMVNRQCASGLQAIANIANRILANEIDVGIGAGVESMSIFPMRNMKLSETAVCWSKMQSYKDAMDCILPMGITSDTVATRYNSQVMSCSATGFRTFDMDRSALDIFAAESHRRAFSAQNEGIFAQEICSVGDICLDDGIRSSTTLEGLSKLRPIFTPSGVTTAGNSSQVTDGAAAVLLMRRSVAMKRQIPVLAVWKGYTCCGVPPAVMGIGPSVAIPELLRRLGMDIADLDSIELNEAFASQAMYCIQFLQLDAKRVNPHGGAIALGHPLGATGARLIVSLINTLHLLRKKQNAPHSRKIESDSLYGCASMCVGTGMGAAAVIEVEPTNEASNKHLPRSSL